MNYIGDFAEDEKIFTMFNTFTSDDPSASCTITNFINTDVHIHKDDGVTQRNNAAGITVNTNFDGITGSHMIEIDTNDNTVAGFWVVGHDYFVRIEGATVDGATVNMVVCHFSIENRFMRGTDSAATAAALTTVDTVVDGIQTDLSNATDGLGALKALIDTVDGHVDAILVDTSSTLNDYIVGIDMHVSSVLQDTGTTLPARFTGIEGATFATGTDSLEALRNRGDAEWITATGFNTTTPDAAGTAAGLHATTDGLITTVDGIVDTILIDTNDLQTNQGAWLTAVGFNTTTPPTVVEIQTQLESAGSKILAIEGDTNELQTDWVNGGRLDNLLDGASAPTVGDIRTEMEGAGTKLSEILTDTGTTLPARFDGVEGATFATGTDSLEAIRNQGDSAWITGGGGAAPTATENAIAVWDRVLTGATHNIATSAGRRVREIGAYAIHSGTAQAANGYTITLDAGASADDGVYNRNLIVITDNTGVGQTRTIVDYNGTSKVAIVDRNWRVSPDATSEFQIVADDTPLVVDQGLARAGTATTITLREYASSDDDIYKCNIVSIIAGTGRGQARLVGAYDGTSKIATVCGDDLEVVPDTSSVYVMMPYGAACTSCLTTNAQEQINTEVDKALSDVNLHKHDQNMKAIAFSEY